MRLIFKGTPHLPEYRGWHDGRFVHVPAGGAIEINDAAGAALLLRDFPGVFVQDIDAAPVDRQIKEPVRKKRT
jgi:hypothetical protein